ncbi:ABC transporter ATP-binding protein [Actinomadura sp. 7K507]|nr:ABC transporter ATP-binding protein [Actinomadura sp. 7K507]
MRADGGKARLLGQDPWPEAARLHERLAYVPGDVTFWPDLTGGQVIGLLGRMRGKQDRERRDELIQRFALDPKKKSRTYYKGNRQKVALIAALASDVEMLILDEPTSGLDPLMEDVFRQVVVEERDKGRTVLLSSHILAEVEALCDRVTIIREGRTVEAGTLAELRHLHRLSIEAGTARPPQGLAELPGVFEVRTEGDHVRFEVDSSELESALRHLADAGVHHLTSRPPSLEELFLRYYDTADSGRAAETSR